MHILRLGCLSRNRESPKTLVSATIEADGVTLTLVFSSPVTASTPAAGWSIEVDAVAGTVSSGIVSSGNIVLTIGEVEAGQVVTVSYDSGAGDVVGLVDITDFAVINNSEQTAASCPISLTGDDAAAFGGVAADISGQTFSVTTAPNTTTRIATTGLASPISITTGKRIIESGSTSFSAGLLTYLFLSNDAAKAVTATWTGAGWTFQCQSPAGSSAGAVNIAGSLADTIAIGVDSATGDAIAFITASGVTSAVTGGTFDAAAVALFSGKTNFALGGTMSPTAGASLSGEFVTSAESYQGDYTGLSDLCGNAI